MQILYIIGNGFDLNLGLKTSYNDFYNFYIKQVSSNDNVNKLKHNISNMYESWSDLELALGNYTQKLGGLDELDDVLLDVGENLSTYLHLEEKKLENLEIDRKVFFNHLSYPENLFLPGDKESLGHIKSKWVNHEWIIDIYTFNYTSIIESIVGERDKETILSTRRNLIHIKLGEIKHIHGYLDNDMVVGVNDISQISNKSFHENRDVLESIVKSECNRANRSNIDKQFTSKINSANLICIFGSSIGETDNKWWQLIGERLKSDCYLILFSKGAEISPRIRHMQARAERSLKDFFLSKTNLNDQEKENAKEKIFIGLNTKMFDGMIKNV